MKQNHLSMSSLAWMVASVSVLGAPLGCAPPGDEPAKASPANLDVSSEPEFSTANLTGDYGQLKLMTYNVHQFLNYQNASNHTAQADAIISHNPDIVVLQEARRSDGYNADDFQVTLNGRTTNDYPYLYEAAHGNAILSKLPFVEVHRLDELPYGDWKRAAFKVAVEVDYGAGSMLVDIIGAHIDWVGDFGEKIEVGQVYELKRLMHPERPTFLMGDLNNTDFCQYGSWCGPTGSWKDDIMEFFLDDFKDPCVLANGTRDTTCPAVDDPDRWTSCATDVSPARLSMQRDHILMRNIRAAEVTSFSTDDGSSVECQMTSDHLPVVMTIQFQTCPTNADQDAASCNYPLCPACAYGEGDCDPGNTPGCGPGLTCGVDNGPSFGLPATWEACIYTGDHYPSTIPTIPDDRIQAEAYDTGGAGVAYSDTSSGNGGGVYRSDDVDVSNGSTDDGYHVSHISEGEWLQYTFDVETSGSYNLVLRHASPFASRRFRVEIDDARVTGLRHFGITADWDTWRDYTLGPISLEAGEHRMRVISVDGGFFLDYLEFEDASAGPYNAVNLEIPTEGHPDIGRIEAEHYDVGGEDVSFNDSTSGNAGDMYRWDNVDLWNDTVGYTGSGGWFSGEGLSCGAASPTGIFVYAITAGEWLRYEVDVTSGNYDITVRYATPNSGVSMKIQQSADGTTWSDVGSSLPLPSTGSWEAWDEATASNRSLTGGTGRYIRLYFTTGGHNIDWVEFRKL